MFNLYEWFNSLSTKSKGLMLVILGNTAISFDSILVRLANVTAWDTTFWFGLYTFIVLGVYILISKKDQLGTIKRDYKELILSGILMSGSVIFFILSIKLTRVANAAVITSSAPIFAALFSLIILKEKTELRTWIAIIFTIIGIAIVVSGSYGEGNVLGDFFALASTAFASMNFVIWRKNPEMSRILSMIVGGAMIAMLTFNFATPTSLSPSSYLILAVMGIITAPWGRLATAISTKYLPVAEVSMYRPLNTVLAPLWVWLLLGELPLKETYIGGGIILITLVINTIYSNKKIKTS